MNHYDINLDRNNANYVPLTPLTFLQRAKDVYPDYEAIVYEDRSYTWNEVYKRAVKFASALSKIGIKKGDTVSFLAFNTPEIFEAHYSVPMTGAVLNTINIRLDANTINYILNHSDAKVLVVDRQLHVEVKKALKNLKYTSGTLTIGNVEIFKLLISKLEIPARWKLRLLRHFWRDDYFNDLLSRLETNADIDPTEVAVDKKRYLNLLKKDPSTMIAGRSIGEILKRFDTKMKDPRRASKGKKVSAIIRSFLKIKCPINNAAKELNKFFKKNKINLVVDQKYFPISSNKVSKLNVMFSTSFGRQLEYYSGMVFKIDIKSNSKIVNCCAGGRYDGLISDLGSKKQVPAVGAAFNL